MPGPVPEQLGLPIAIGPVGAISGFTVDAYDPAPIDEHAEVPEGFQLSRTRIAKTFSGDLAATSVTQAVMAVTQEGSAGCVAIELIVGSLQGR